MEGTMTKFTTDDIRHVHNDTSLTPREIAQALKDCVLINYGDFGAHVPIALVADARTRWSAVKSNWTQEEIAEEREAVVRDIERSLREAMEPPLKKRIMDKLMRDVVAWHVMKES
jgi:hypothetical protein